VFLMIEVPLYSLQVLAKGVSKGSTDLRSSQISGATLDRSSGTICETRVTRSSAHNKSKLH